MSAQQGAFLCCDDRASGALDREHTGRHVYFCIRLSEAAVERSAVLDGLCSAPGVATLPAVVSEEDFLLWSKCDPRSPPEQIEDLVKVLRVADALSDKRMPAWVKVMADHAASTQWLNNTNHANSRQIETMHAALLSLSPDVRTSVLRNLIDSEPDALGLLPQTLHPYLVAAMIGTDGALSCPDNEGLHLKFLSQLRSLPGCGHPPLQSLDMIAMDALPSVCHGIVDALPSNPRLSILRLNLPGAVPCTVMSAMNVLCSSLAAATSLREIYLQHRDSCLPLPALVPLVRALPALPSLERLHLHDIDERAFLDGPLETADADGRRGHWRRLLAAVASHPGLTCLSLTCYCAFEPLPWPEAFPRLQELNLDLTLAWPVKDVDEAAVSDSRKAPTRHPRFPALSRLKFSSSGEDYAAATPLEPAFWLPIGKGGPPCPAMRSLDVHVDLQSLEDETEEVVMQSCKAVSCVVDACPGLEELSIKSYHDDIMAAIVCSHLCSLRNTSIRSLHLKRCGAIGRRREDDLELPLISPEQASEAVTAMHSLSSLRSLSLDAVADPTRCYALRAVQNMAVGSLPDLTRLCFRMSPETDADTCIVSTGGIVEWLQTRTGLRSVEMVCWVLSGAVAQQLWDALVSMPHLQELALNPTAVPEAAVRGLAAALPRMTALTFLNMRRVQWSNTSHLSRDLDVVPVELLAGELSRRGAVLPRPLRLVYYGPSRAASQKIEQAMAAVNIHCVNATGDSVYNSHPLE